MRKARRIAMLLLLAMVVMAMGCCTQNRGADSMRLGDGKPPLPDREFFQKMEAGYKSSFPDQEEVLFTKGFCTVEGLRYATFAWRDDRGKLSVALNGHQQALNGHGEFPVIGIAGIGSEIIGENCSWIPTQKGLFTYISMGKAPDNPDEMFKQVQRGLKKSGASEIELLLPRR